MSTLVLPLRRLLSVLLLAVVATALLWSPAARAAQESDPVDAGTTVEVLPVQGLLDPPVADAITSLLADAAASDADLVILQVDGPGGVSVDTAGLVDAVADSEVPVAVLVAPQAGTGATAGGAWAAVWAAADVRVVSEVGAIGPLQPLDLAQPADDELIDELVVRLAGDDPDRREVAQSLVDTTVDAATLESAGLADLVAPDYLVLMSELDGREVASAGGTATLELGEDVTVRLHSMGLIARMLHAAATPAFIYLLLVVGLGLLAFELFQPGFGVAGIAGLVMLPFAIFGLTVLPVAWWALALLLVGLVLYVVDTAVAGFGWTTAVATAAFGVGSWFVFGTDALRNPAWVAIATTVVALGFWVVVMTVILRAQAGPEGVDLDELVGRLGIVRSVLNPEGHVFIDDALWRARLTGRERLRVSSAIRVVGVDGAVLVVEAFDPDEPRGTGPAGGGHSGVGTEAAQEPSDPAPSRDDADRPTTITEKG